VFEIGFAEDRDVDGLKAVWRECFGDSPAYIDAFYGAVFRPERTLAARDGRGDVSGGLYLLEARLKDEPVNVLYALGVRGKDRCRGIASALIQRAQALSRAENRALLLSPASEKLVRYYEKRGFHVAMRERVTVLEARADGRLRSVVNCAAEDYERIRSLIPAADGEVRWTDDMLRWAVEENRLCGGRCVRFLWENTEGAALLLEEKDMLRVEQLLLPGDRDSVCAALAFSMGKSQARQTARGSGTDAVSGMLCLSDRTDGEFALRLG